MSESSSIVQIKGLRDSLLVSLADAPWDVQRAALLAQIDGQPAFFQGARLALDVGPQVIKVNDMVQLRDHLSERNVSLWAVVSESPTTEMTAQLLGLATRVSRPRPEEQHAVPPQEITDETALFLNKTLRSGTRVEFGGSVVVLGDVNPGAEIVADGSVIVWGKLRGAVAAGTKGNESAVVCALELSPMRLQLGKQTLESADREESGIPEMAVLRNGTIVIQSWQTGSMG
ncbi:MAG TPA: septum site-determining protein MinC [Anaerolineales bacterium]